MKSGVRSVWLARLGLAVAVALLVPAIAAAAGRNDRANPSQTGDVVEMFSAIEQGRIGVKLIPKDSTQCRVMIENKTNKPLTVKLPDAFAGVPVLAQIGGAGAGAGGRNTGGGGGMQGMGGGMGGMGGGGMGGMGGGGMGGMGGGMFNVPPEKVAQLKVPTVCLDHGKAEPRPNVPYQIKPIEQYSDKPAVRELVRLLGEGRINQRAAQAAAWHLNNNMSWEQLAAKQRRFANGTARPYFREEIMAAMQVSGAAASLAEKRKSEPSSGGSLSQHSSN